MEQYNRISPDVVLGKDVKLACFINAYGCSIGDRTKVGAFVEIQKGARIGADCKISSHAFICEGVTIGDGAFIGHHVVFINDKYPHATNRDGALQTEADWKVVATHVGKGASIGSNATILCGLTIHDGAMVGAGSVVTKSVPSKELWAGNPARFIRKLESA
jgi:UDP-2-acetamido-3-amino-2,3-dideoxy-glucuronate N-acetyltransferase